MPPTTKKKRKIAICETEAIVLEGREGKSLVLTIAGEPDVLQRPRVNYKNRQVPTIYDPDKKKKEQQQKAIINALKDIQEQTPVFQKEDKLEIKIKYNLRFHTKKDVDNLTKYTLDVLQKVVFPDDRQIYHVTATKIPGDEVSAHTSIIVQPYNK